MKKKQAPWQSPLSRLWFVGALAFAGWATVTMPGHGSGTEKVFAKLFFFGRLFTLVGCAAFLGGLMEARQWTLGLGCVMRALTRLARLPGIVALAMPAALCSNAAANSILVSSHAEGKIPTSALIAGGMANSYLAFVSHSLRVMIPVVGAIGLPGVLYFGVQFFGGFFVLLVVFLWHRRYAAPLGEFGGEVWELSPPLSWRASARRAGLRAASLLFRLVIITVPLMLGIEWLSKQGAFSFWEQLVPAQVNRFFPAELVSVVGAQLGGLVSSATVAAGLRAEGLIDNAHILLALLVGSAVGNPFRTLRRNLPSALGIFSVPVALTIVGGMQVSRLLTTLVATGCVIAWMHSFM